MVIAALETVTPSGSVALLRGAAVESRSGDASRKHGERLPAELTDWLAAHGVALPDVDLFTVVTGPGSFTGLRVGVAAIQGLALAGKRSVVGVPTLDALATTWLLGAERSPAVLVACLDGQRGEVFVAAWVVDGGSSIDESARLLEPRAARPEALATLLAHRPADRPLIVVGDGGQRYGEVVQRLLPEARILAAPMPLAEAAARIGASRANTAVGPHAIRPVYLRRPDAEIARERAGTAEPPGSRPPYRLRRAHGRDDVAAVEALQRQTFANPWGAEAIRWELENTDVARLYVMHDEAGVLVAYCACWMVFDELHINSLAVDVLRRRQGLARALLTYVLAEAAAGGAEAATLEVRSSNQAARGLYAGMGFAIEGLRRDYYQDPREDAVILWKRRLQARRGDSKSNVTNG